MRLVQGDEIIRQRPGGKAPAQVGSREHVVRQVVQARGGEST